MENIHSTPNRMTFNGQTDENQNVLISTFKSSPKSPASKAAEKKKHSKKKASKKAPRHRNRLSSQSSEASDRPQQQVGAPYNLIEFFGDRSRGESARPDELPTEDPTSSCLQAFPTRGEISAAGISIHQTPKKVIFVIPEGWASSIEIMRLPPASSLNSLNDSPADSVGPIRSKARVYRGSRNSPYYTSRRDKRSFCDGSMLTSSRNGAENPSIPENAESSGYYTVDGGFGKLEPRDYQQTPSSIGPIRRSSKRRTFYTPYGSRNYNSTDSASTSTSDSYNQAESDPYFSGKNYSKNYSHANNSNKYKLCWHCQRRGHIRINCPTWRVTHRKY